VRKTGKSEQSIKKNSLKKTDMQEREVAEKQERERDSFLGARSGVCFVVFLSDDSLDGLSGGRRVLC
jgi:hypothetical protein